MCGEVYWNKHTFLVKCCVTHNNRLNFALSVIMANLVETAKILIQQPEVHASIVLYITIAILAVRFYFGVFTNLGNFIIFVAGLLITKRLSLGRSVRFTSTPSLNGKTVIITGGNTGIGLETAKQLAKYGAEVFIACRDEGRGKKALEEIKIYAKKPEKIFFEQLDLASLDNVSKFVKNWGEKKIDILINNAGVMMCPYSLTKDGFELQFGTNHLGHFYLTTSLLDNMNENGRIVNVSSLAHIGAPKNIDWTDLANKKNYNAVTAYAISKISNIYFTTILQEKLNAQRKKISVFAVHPGYVRTELMRHFGPVFRTLLAPLAYLIAKNSFIGAQTSIHCAAAPLDQLHPGEYYFDCEVGTPTKLAQDKQMADSLWKISEDFINKKN